MMRWRGTLDRLDLYHGTNFKLQTTGRFGGVVTIHDLWLDRHPQYSPKLLGQRASFYRTKRTARRARKVITISEYSARDIESLYGLPRNRIVVIPCGVADDFRPTSDTVALQDLRRRLAFPTDRFILFVGGADPRKNHKALLQAYAHRAGFLKAYSVVMVGDPVHRFGNMMETARALGLEDRVVCTGRLSIADLRLLYTHADVFAFPSLYEGFGMPVLEAMACGAPVITSSTTALPEVVGDAAVLVSPEDSEELAEAMVRVLEDPVLRAELKAKGFERVRRFTWERVARQTLAVYRELCQ
jgi:glycosyltransferase involved in cell wall biosynthesis